MPEARLTPEEAGALRSVLASVAVRTRTGQVGIGHAGRFVATDVIVRKPTLNLLDSVAHKVGLGSGIRRDSS
jgi:hypothetical protein